MKKVNEEEFHTEDTKVHGVHRGRNLRRRKSCQYATLTDNTTFFA